MLDTNIYYPSIPEYVVVHLGVPDDESVENVTVTFIDYIKNVASSEIYPSWPEASLRANILAQISFALNRIYTEFYRSEGYDFDITNSPKFDQTFINNRDYFDNISRIVDEIFNDYIVKHGSIEPFFAEYCDGINVQCDGLSQWGTVALAERGDDAYDILTYYYGDDINLVTNASVQPNIESYPGRPLELGDSGDDVRIIQRELNRIGDNYPAIPKISNVSLFFNVETDSAVRKFQEVFNLSVDGVVGKATWYKIKLIYNSVKKLSELVSEGLSMEEISREYPKFLEQGAQGEGVKVFQYFLSVIAFFDDDIPLVNVDGIFDDNTKDAVIAFQRKYGLEVNGEVDRTVWNKIRDVYDVTINTIPEKYEYMSSEIYPGRFLSPGITGDDVKTLQEFLVKVSNKNSSIPKVDVTGIYDEKTREAIEIIQVQNKLPVTGVTDPITWNTVVNLSK